MLTWLAKVTLVLALIAVRVFPVNSVTPNRYQIDLDKQPEERWKEIAIDYKYQIKTVIADILELFQVSNKSIQLVTIIADNLEFYLPTEIAREIHGLSAYSGIPLGELLIYNILHEITSFCTSIVVEDEYGAIIHGRNLDFGMTNSLKDSVIIVDVTRYSDVVCTGITYAGYVGLFTGVKQDAFSLSANDRYSGDLLENILELLLNRQGKFVGLVMRELLQSDTAVYREALLELQTVELIAPCYVILGGVSPGEGAVITRGREGEIDVRFIDTDNNKWYVLETNYDWWNPPGDNRRAAAIQALESAGRKKMTGHGLYQVLSTPYVCNNLTTFTAIMSAGIAKEFNVIIREEDTKCVHV
ncbi:N-acylethanolamine-hydrolyzing acid amidase-like [Oopsacas minuta]|uniref:N-acylethanolamine-hydrolyzing acid amidase n=1 Tax=Oopsacas minuta TaxID=111878 RepID=A0AAV7K6F4_9METZ|nr:N-acylethanolamine-hydrolyzing acid amidase-like [Oopsacas minuta]